MKEINPQTNPEDEQKITNESSRQIFVYSRDALKLLIATDASVIPHHGRRIHVGQSESKWNTEALSLLGYYYGTTKFNESEFSLEQIPEGALLRRLDKEGLIRIKTKDLLTFKQASYAAKVDIGIRIPALEFNLSLALDHSITLQKIIVSGKLIPTAAPVLWRENEGFEELNQGLRKNLMKVLSLPKNLPEKD